MNNHELVSKLQNIVDNYNTVYMWGVFGAPVTEKLIQEKTRQYPSWYTTARNAAYRKLIGKNYFGFDCVNVIKGLLWGWTGDNTKAYGGASYAVNGVPDVSANGMLDQLQNISSNFSNIEIGEAVWMDGHIGTYIGNGKVIECTPSWSNNVQVTACGNIGEISGLHTRTWTKHGKLPFVSYVQAAPEIVGNGNTQCIGTGTVTADKLNQRDYPGTNGIKTGEYINGDRIWFYEQYNGWLRVCPTTSKWVSAEFVKIDVPVLPPDPVPTPEPEPIPQPQEENNMHRQQLTCDEIIDLVCDPDRRNIWKKSIAAVKAAALADGDLGAYEQLQWIDKLIEKAHNSAI